MARRYRFPHQLLRFPVEDCRTANGNTLNIDGFRQVRNYTCGYVTTAMVLTYFGASIHGKDLFARLGTGRDGTRQGAIVRELRMRGVRANVRYDVDFERIRTEVDRGKLIVSYLADVEHWVVIYGYQHLPCSVFVADPRPNEVCMQDWEHYGPRLNRFGIVCSQASPLVTFSESSSLASTMNQPVQLGFPF